MDVITLAQLKQLAARAGGPCVSLFMPTHRSKPEVRQDPIRFKNLVRRAEEELVATGMRAPEARELLAPARALFDDTGFWLYQADGLAVFLAADFFRVFRLPLAAPELAVVADRFHLKPVLALFAGDGRFYLLALSQGEIRLLEGTRDRMVEIEPEGIPRSLEAALGREEAQRQLQFHTGTPSRGGQRSAVFHGQGVGVDDAKDRILRFFREVDRGVTALLKDSPAPLILAGVDYLLPIYREASNYPLLLAEGVTGNPEGLSSEALHARAWPLVEPEFLRALQAAGERYRELAGTGRTGADVRVVLPRAAQGRVETLFVALGVQQWGTFDEASGALQLRAEPRPGDEDLLNAAALQAILTGATVYVVPQDQVPEDTPIAAVYRY